MKVKAHQSFDIGQFTAARKFLQNLKTLGAISIIFALAAMFFLFENRNSVNFGYLPGTPAWLTPLSYYGYTLFIVIFVAFLSARIYYMRSIIIAGNLYEYYREIKDFDIVLELLLKLGRNTIVKCNGSLISFYEKIHVNRDDHFVQEIDLKSIISVSVQREEHAIH